MGLRRVESVTWSIACDDCGLSSTGQKDTEGEARAAAVAVGLKFTFPINRWVCESCRAAKVLRASNTTWKPAEHEGDCHGTPDETRHWCNHPAHWQPLANAAETTLRSDQMQTHCGVAETLHGTPIGEHATSLPSGMQKDYVVLTAEERAKGFVEPVRRTYRHIGPQPPKYPLRDLTDDEKKRTAAFHYDKYETYPEGSQEAVGSILGRYWTTAELERARRGACGSTTTMGQQLSETYARCPDFYGSTFCCTCREHFPVGAKGEFVWDGTDQKVGTTSKPHACDDEPPKT